MLKKHDQIRNHVLGQPESYDREVVEFVKAVYTPKADLAAKFEEDRERFERAVKKCGLTGLAQSEPVAELAFQFDEPLDLDLAAAEAGVSTHAFATAVKSNAALGRELGGLVQGQPVPRVTYVKQFASLVRVLKTGTYLLVEGKLAGEDRSDNSLKLKLCWCPPGTFKMGSPPSEPNRIEGDEQQVEVTLNNGFWLGTYEVTQKQWASVMRTTLLEQRNKENTIGVIKGEGDQYPMYWVSYEDAIEFCKKLTGNERDAGTLPLGYVYRLPSEAEWEYACRAGTTAATAFGNSLSSSQANFDGNTPYNGAAKGVYRYTTIEVGSLSHPNTWGLHDMHGNVWEWCADVYKNELPGGDNPIVFPLDKTSFDCVVRGGSWAGDGSNCRSAIRNYYRPGLRKYNLGFRIALGPELK